MPLAPPSRPSRPRHPQAPRLALALLLAALAWGPGARGQIGDESIRSSADEGGNLLSRELETARDKVETPSDDPAPAPGGPAGGKKEKSGSPAVAKTLSLLGDAAAEDKMRIQSLRGFLNYDEENGLIYANERTEIAYRGVTIIADQLRLDIRQGQVEAAGDVELKHARGDVRASKLYYNFKNQEGKAYQAAGEYTPLHFKHKEGEGEDDPSFQMVSEKEVLLHGASLTTCDMAVPHYRVSAREIILYLDDRVFLRGATLYIWEVPVFYFPAYTRSLKERSPWYFWGGYHSRMGAWMRVGYTYKHETLVPDLADDQRLRVAARGQLSLFANEFTKRGPGGGLHYRYQFDDERHRGSAGFFYVDDLDRPVTSRAAYDQFYTRYSRSGNRLSATPWRSEQRRYNPEPELQRYQILAEHRSEIGKGAYWLLDADYISDPELYDEALDLFEKTQRRRVMERNARTSLNLVRDQFAARLVVEMRDRIGRDRISNFSNPEDILRDYDEQPELPISDRTDEGLATSRWGNASLRAPQATVETSWIKLWNLPLYYHTDLNLFNNLDKGLNTVSTRDDSFVQGADWYQSLLWRLRLGDRLTWINQAGAGAGMAQREDDSFHYLDAADFGQLNGEPWQLVPNESVGGLTFRDPETFLIGQKPFNLRRDVDNQFGYADFRSRLHARFTDALSGDASYKYRGTNGTSLGEWYAEMGNRHALDDLYGFPLRENNLDATLRHTLSRPRIDTRLRVFHNLIEKASLYPYEPINEYSWNTLWTNVSDTLNLGGAVSFSDRQMYHPTDANAYVNSSVRYGAFAGYRPAHKVWWGNLGVDYAEKMDRPIGDEDYNRYIETQSPYSVSASLGGQVGPKYVAAVAGSFRSDYGTLHRLTLSLQRDLHDARVTGFLIFRQDPYTSKYNATEKRDAFSFTDQMDFRFAITPKLPDGKTLTGIPGVSVLESGASDGPGSRSSGGLSIDGGGQ